MFGRLQRTALKDDQSDQAAGIAYERRGSGPPLILIHPLGADRHVWDPVVGLLQSEREVITVDLPGFGESPALTGVVPEPAALASAVASLIEALAIDGKPHVAGNSLGGWVALELAARGAVASVTAIAPAGLWTRPLAPKPEIARRAARLFAPAATVVMRSERVRRLALAGSAANPAQIPAAEAAALIRAYASAPGFTAVNSAMRANVFAALAKIEVPVTLVWPERDRLIARPSAIPPGVREIALARCGHIPMWDDPQAVASALLVGSGSGGGGA